MEAEEHYDTPWEFKNKAIAAVLNGGLVNGGGGQSSKSAKGRSPSTDENFFQDTLMSPSQPSSNTFKKSQPLQVYPVQPSCSHLNDKNKSTKQGFRVSQHQPAQSHSPPPHQRRFSTTSCESHQNQAVVAFYPNQQDRSRLSFERASKPVFNPGSGVPFVSSSPLSPGPSTGQWNEPPQTSVMAYPLVGKMSYENGTKKNYTSRNSKEFCQQSHARKSSTFDETSMVHEGMERVQAEQLLKPMDVGDFLLRRRNEGNLALSLRSLDGVLHIKLEMRDSLWILGEGPKFSSISGMLRCYRKNELPVRGAEHVRLKSPLTTAEVAMVMHTTRKKSQSP